MTDMRLVASIVALLLSIGGYILLVIQGHTSEAKDLLTLISLPSLTFIIGLGSSIVKE